MNPLTSSFMFEALYKVLRRVALPALKQHFVRGRVQIRKHFAGDAGIPNQRRNCLHNLPIFRRFFFFGELVSRLNQAPDFGVLGD